MTGFILQECYLLCNHNKKKIKRVLALISSIHHVAVDTRYIEINFGI